MSDGQASAAAGMDALGFASALRARLDAITEAGRTIDLWWRDDDAVAATPALDRLIDLAEVHDVPLALAVIPAGADASLGARVAAASGVGVLQHGWQHRNHQPAGARAAELGDARPVDAVLGELDAGRRRLEGLFGDRFLPVLTPPWNRIAPAVAARRGEAGLPGLSTFALREAAPGRVDTHLDPIAWKAGRGFRGWQRMLDLFDEEVAARAALPAPAPIGLLTHHLAHDEDVWAFTEAVLAATAGHPAVRWPSLPAVFGSETPEAA